MMNNSIFLVIQEAKIFKIDLILILNDLFSIIIISFNLFNFFGLIVGCIRLPLNYFISPYKYK